MPLLLPALVSKKDLIINDSINNMLSLFYIVMPTNNAVVFLHRFSISYIRSGKKIMLENLWRTRIDNGFIGAILKLIMVNWYRNEVFFYHSH